MRRPAKCSRRASRKPVASMPINSRPELETVEIDSIKGKVAMRACDHQAVQKGFMVKVVRKDGYTDPIPELIATFPADQVTPACRQMTYDS